jgi:hypothetical protein
VTRVDPNDAAVLRELGEWQAAAAASPANREKIAAWYAHDAWGPGRRPMVMDELRDWTDGEGPVPKTALRCRADWARGLEYRMRIIQREIYTTHCEPARLARWVELAREECAAWRP